MDIDALPYAYLDLADFVDLLGRRDTRDLI